MHTYTHTCTHASLHTYVHAHMNTHTCTHAYLHTYVHAHTHVLKSERRVGLNQSVQGGSNCREGETRRLSRSNGKRYVACVRRHTSTCHHASARACSRACSRVYSFFVMYHASVSTYVYFVLGLCVYKFACVCVHPSYLFFSFNRNEHLH